MDQGDRMIRVGCGQITWRGVPEPQALADIAEAGYEGAPPKLAPGRSPGDTLSLFAGCGLAPAPCYYGAPFWEPERRAEIVDGAREAARFSRAIGCTELYAAAHGEYRARSGRTRREASGHVSPDDALSDGELAVLVDTLNEVGRATLGEGVRTCFHNHVGTVIETEEEVERLLARADPALVFLGPDTGHLAWGGADAAAFCRRHVDRIASVHLKDIDEGVRRRGAGAGWDYGAFVEAGIFRELGEGDVDLPGVLGALKGAGFSGWVIVETDATRLPSARESATVSRRHLREMGL